MKIIYKLWFDLIWTNHASMTYIPNFVETAGKLNHGSSYDTWPTGSPINTMTHAN